MFEVLMMGVVIAMFTLIGMVLGSRATKQNKEYRDRASKVHVKSAHLRRSTANLGNEQALLDALGGGKNGS